MKLKTLLILSLFVVTVYAGKKTTRKTNKPTTTKPPPDSKISNVIKLTESGDHSFPVFSSDGLKIYFSAKNGKYGTKCDHVYQMDIRDIENIKEISLYSTGIGHETRPVGYNPEEDTYSIVSNIFFSSAKKGEWLTSGLNDFFCPEPKCENVPDDDPTKKACDFRHNIIHYDGEVLLHLDGNGVFDNVFKPSDDAKWRNQAIRFVNGNEVYSEYYPSKSGEQIVKKPNDGNAEAVEDTLGVWDGFNGIYDKSNRDDTYYFYGSPDGTNPDSIKNGVISLEKSKIHQAKFATNGNAVVKDIFGLPLVSQKRANMDPNYYAYPHPDPNDLTRVLVTGIDPDKAKLQDSKDLALYFLHDNQGGGKPITDPNVNSFQGSIDPNGKYIVFVSDRDQGNQLYLGIVENRATKFPPPTPVAEKPVAADRFGEWIKETFSYVLKSDNDKVKSAPSAPFNSPKLDRDKSLMYVAGDDCPQIYQLNLARHDISVPKKMSSGIHAYESPNFIDNENILFAATISRIYKPESEIKCSVKVCKKPASDKINELCKGVVVEKSLPTESDIYTSNKFGSLDKRLTTSANYTGEARVFGKYVYFSSYGKNKNEKEEEEEDYNIYQLEFNSETPEQELMKGIGYGFEGDIAVSADGNLLAYYAHRITDEESDKEEKERFKNMHKNQFTDVSKTELYIYSIEKKVESKITDHGGRVISPVFISDTSIVYVLVTEDKYELHSATFSIDEEGKVSASKKQPVEMKTKIHDLTYFENKQLVFADEDNVYIAKTFEPNFDDPPQTDTPKETTASTKKDDTPKETSTASTKKDDPPKETSTASTKKDDSPKTVPTKPSYRTKPKPTTSPSTPSTKDDPSKTNSPTRSSTTEDPDDDNDFAYKPIPIVTVIFHMFLLKLFI